MTSRAEQLKAELIDRVAKLASSRLDKTRAAPVERFIRAFYANVPPDDILGDTPENLFGAALSLWNFGLQREPGRPKLRVYNPRLDQHGWRSPHTVVEAVNDDMPFLVDSITVALNRRELNVHLVIHPIVRIARDAAGRVLPDGGDGAGNESYMQVWVSEQTDAEALESIRGEIDSVLGDVRAAVEDWEKMRARIAEVIAEIDRQPPPLPAEEVGEGKAFLAWLEDDHFTFLGYREYAFSGAGESADRSIRPESGLGILRNEEASVFDGLRHFDQLPPEVQYFLRQSQLLMITKSNRRATVHRAAPMDTMGVKRFDAAGHVIGARLFLGLLTSVAYSRSPREIPLLRRKIANCVARAGFAPSSHDGKALVHILETYPRDELFQIPEDELLETALGILHLQDRQRIALFARKDPFERFVSCLIYLPRDRYNSELARRFRKILRRAYNGRIVGFNTQMTDAPLGRLHIIVATTPGAIPDVDPSDVERRLVEAGRSWVDRLQEALVEAKGEEQGLVTFRRYAEAFPIGYRERFDARVAAFDIERIEEALAADRVAMNLYRPVEATGHELRLKLYSVGEQIALSDVLPMLEHMGLRVVSEIPFRVDREGSDHANWIHDFGMTSQDGAEVDLGRVRDLFHEAYARIWAGEMEDDGFNRLVLRAGLDWREVTVLRAYCKYLRQAAIPFSQAYMEETLADNPQIAGMLVRLYRTLFDSADRREAEVKARGIEVEIEHALDAVTNLDEDRIIRRYRNVIGATLRTNFFQQGAGGEPKPYLSFKLDSRNVEELPLPRPLYEIFLYAPRVEAVHLRGGKVARGGIRWSDRREDFRTEVLGLMKAQMVKNAVIVPVGSKGGFVVKRPPATGGRDALMGEVVECYKTMMRGLLDLTDNRVGDDIMAPRQVVRRDDDDPYLVVAADKGTATFSDIANGISAEYGLWLGDAFASGGSAGYDHKKMGITARGAWESVKRHFREIGIDIQSSDFTAVGIGDMSGDVFGNGMLQSPHIKLLSAFNHLHIFVDPDPDPAASFAERRRLFDLPRSAWSDYDPKLISPGGGVFERKAKSIRLTPQIKARFGIVEESLTPNELIRTLLMAEVDLFWLGGIGTYVKASNESHAEVGDRGNDPVRVDASALRCKVIGEGANLGVTQRGRIEYALAGGRLNNDAIDNSAGVDCSDHEVNIKILLNEIVAAGDMTRKQRDKLLEAMAEEVGALVLRDNYLQSQAISVAHALGWKQLDQQGRFIRALERPGKLDRGLEFLPTEEEIRERITRREGLTRPEIAILLAYAKIALSDELLPSNLPDDPQLVDDLLRYFPQPLRERYPAEIARHRLRREIIATVVTSSLVNRVGPTFVHVMKEKTSLGAPEIARGYAITRGVFALRNLWAAIEALDNAVPASVQTAMLIEINRAAELGTLWFLRNGRQPLDIAEHIAAYRPGLATLIATPDLVPQGERAGIRERIDAHVADGVPEGLATEIAILPLLAPSLDIVRIAGALGAPVERVARLYFAVGERFGLDWLRAAAGGVPADSHWDRMATAAILEDLYGHQAELARHVLAAASGDTLDPGAAIDAWVQGRATALQRMEALLADLRQAGVLDLAKLAVANRELRSLVSA